MNDFWISVMKLSKWEFQVKAECKNEFFSGPKSSFHDSLLGFPKYHDFIRNVYDYLINVITPHFVTMYVGLWNKGMSFGTFYPFRQRRLMFITPPK